MNVSKKIPSLLVATVLNSADFQKGTDIVIMADATYKTKDKSNILKKLSKKFYTLSIKNSFHEIQLDVFLDPFKVRRERNSIIMAKQTTSITHSSISGFKVGFVL